MCMKTKAVKDYDVTENGVRKIAYTINVHNGAMQEFGGRITITLPSPFHFNGDKIKNLIEHINNWGGNK